jgi:hypothetical protein
MHGKMRINGGTAKILGRTDHNHRWFWQVRGDE